VVLALNKFFSGIHSVGCSQYKKLSCRWQTARRRRICAKCNNVAWPNQRY